MSIRITTLLALTAATLAAGCSTALKVTYTSDPPGAALYQGTTNFGYTPVTLEYKPTDEDKRRGVMNLQGTSVKWASGASASISTLSANLNQYGLNQSFNFQRPDIAGREIDMQFALELQKLAIMRQQARAQQDQAYYQFLSTLRQPVRTQTNCTSSVIGNTVYTNCN